MIPRPLFLVPGTWPEWRHWFSAHGPQLAGIILALILVRLLFHQVVGRILRQATARAVRARREDPAAVRRRADTLLSTLDWVATIFLLFIGTALLLDQFDIQVSALVAGVGVAGIAIGLGTQTLVRDVINGAFILIEGQYAVGDVVTVAGATGEVIEINPRRTVVRDADGNVHSIPNSAITVAVNRTPGLGRVTVDIEVPFRESEGAIALADEVCAELADSTPGRLLVAPRVVGQEALPEGDVRLRIAGDARPQERWQVEADLRRRLKRRFDANAIEMRFGDGDQKPA